MQHFIKESQFRASPERLFAFHERPDALALLTPPWQKTEVIQPPASLAAGTRVKLRTRVGPFWQIIEAEHVSYEKGRSFADRMVKGPFRYWLHHHEIVPSNGGSILRDAIEYELPLGALGQLGGGWFVRGMLEKLFAYRHEVTRRHVDGEGS